MGVVVICVSSRFHVFLVNFVHMSCNLMTMSRCMIISSKKSKKKPSCSVPKTSFANTSFANTSFSCFIGLMLVGLDMVNVGQCVIIGS